MTQQVTRTNVSVRDMNAADVDNVVDVHMRAFPEYLLTHMGRGYLRHYYSAFLSDVKHYAMVAQVDGRVVGFVAGTLESERLSARVYRPSIGIALGVAIRFIADPVLRKHLLAKRMHITKMFRVVSRRKTAATAPPVSTVPARLLSIGVSPDSQRMGIAQALVNGFNNRLNLDGIAMVGLSVRHDNVTGIAFYDRTGWERELADKNGIYYMRSTAG